jgi:hypothetical protein
MRVPGVGAGGQGNEVTTEGEQIIKPFSARSSPARRELSAGQLVPLDDVHHFRLLLQIDDDRDVEIDPIAFLLTNEGVVRTDANSVLWPT